jgi:hypothetical protein
MLCGHEHGAAFVMPPAGHRAPLPCPACRSLIALDLATPQELLDCLDLLLAVEKVDDVRAHLGPILARKQAGLLASFTQVAGGEPRAGGPGGLGVEGAGRPVLCTQERFSE